MGRIIPTILVTQRKQREVIARDNVNENTSSRKDINDIREIFLKE
jgi:hypothetical protein